MMFAANAVNATTGDWARRLLLLVLVAGMGMLGASEACAASMNPALLPTIQAATFEVVAAKPTHDPLSYEKPLPMDLIPYQQRSDKYYSIGTAFAIGDNRYVTAGHVLEVGVNSLWGLPELRDAKGNVYAIDKIEKFSLEKDFVVFSLKNPPSNAALKINTKPGLNQVVFAVGNALGTGVIIRDGLYTSNTPENQDGRWKWMRFSAAASPGNSGGPLLDNDGNVIGVVLAKSPNENLNYALPMSEVVNAPAHVAEMDKRIPYSFDVFDTTLSNVLKAKFALPLSLADFYASYSKSMQAFEDAQLKAILAKDPGKLFPQGPGSSKALHAVGTYGPLPTLIIRDSNGIWGRAKGLQHRTDLADNGFLSFRVIGNNILFHVRRPDSLPADQLYGHPAKLMDLLVKAGFMRRTVGSERVRMTSLGKPTLDTEYTDAWQRHWRTLEWPIPYANGRSFVMALPVPDGYVGILRNASASNEHDYLINLKALTDFVAVTYNGTLEQWKAFLGHADLLPGALRRTRIAFDYGTRFSYDSNRVKFDFTPKLQKIAKDSQLSLGFSFFKDHDKVVWGANLVRVAANAHDSDSIAVVRVSAPSPDLDDAYKNNWNKIAHRLHPLDAVTLDDNDVTRIASVVGPPASAHPAALYTVHINVEGTQSQAQMKDKLDALLKNVHVTESIGTAPAAASSVQN